MVKVINYTTVSTFLKQVSTWEFNSSPFPWITSSHTGHNVVLIPEGPSSPPRGEFTGEPTNLSDDRVRYYHHNDSTLFTYPEEQPFPIQTYIPSIVPNSCNASTLYTTCTVPRFPKKQNSSKLQQASISSAFSPKALFLKLQFNNLAGIHVSNIKN